ncbi:MAG: prolyl oligopeptidase family serine peptidase, partial [Candidatus Thermoplasmatota archaeon]|nr:prolyl oligopeptidase family serine peptidase [Candidatus Thermoplasmatota archaeon]
NVGSDYTAAYQSASTSKHVVAQTFDGISPASPIDVKISFDQSAYNMSVIYYPTTTSNGENNFTCQAVMIVPKNVPANGYKLLMVNHGRGQSVFEINFWYFLGNEGYIVAHSNLTSDNYGGKFNDWGYNQQLEIDQLRQYAISNCPVDLDRQYVLGSSLGGFNTMLCLENHPDVYAAGAVYAGPYDLKKFYNFTQPITGTDFTRSCGGTWSEHPYEWAIRNPIERVGQISAKVVVVAGNQDMNVIYNDHPVPFHNAVPGSILYTVENAAHEFYTWESYRKEVFNLFESAVRIDAQENAVDGLFYGRPEYVSDGYVQQQENLRYSNSWLSVELQDKNFTHIVASISGAGCNIKVDRQSIIAVTIPEGAGGAFITDPILAKYSRASFSQGKFEFTVQPNTDYEISFGAEKTSGFFGVSGFGAMLALTGLAGAAIAFGRLRRRG